MRKHTPGPWQIEEGTLEVQDRHGITVADVFGVDGERSANALLIAASTDLLESLVDTMGMLGVLQKQGIIRETFIMERARASVAKALGAKLVKTGGRS